MAVLAERHGIRVVVDEFHGPLVLEGATFGPYLSVDGSDTAFSLTSASKGWHLAGLKAGLAIAGPAAAADLARLPEEVSHGPSHLGLIAHTAALRDGCAGLNDLPVALSDNRRLLTKLLREHLPTVGSIPPEATYLAWLDCRALGFDQVSADSADRGVVTALAGPAAVFLEHARVALSSGHVFGTGGTGHVRLNFATSPDLLTAEVTRMGKVI